MRSYKRSDRVASLIKDALSEILVLAVGDPRVVDAVVTFVKVSPDFSIARVHVRSLVSDDQGRTSLMAGLAASRAYLRTELAHRVLLPRMPQLEFYYDNVEDEAARLEVILDRLALERKDG